MIKYSDHAFRPIYSLGDIVYHRACDDAVKGVIISITLYVDGGLTYEVSWGDKSNNKFYEAELTDEFIKDFSQ